MNYEECCRQVGYDSTEYNPPVIGYKYYGYKDGKVIECKTEQEARKYKNHEFVVDPVMKQVRDSYYAKRRELEKKANRLFEILLRGEYLHLSDEVYNKCYSKAYEDGHAYGYDEVAMYLSEIVDFVEDIIKLTKS